MKISKDENGQGSAEYILLFGGIIIVVVIAILIYRAYFSNNSALKASNDINSVRGSVNTPKSPIKAN